MKDIIKAEYLKCAQDPVYFLKKYAVIQHPMRGKVPFELYPFQEDSLNQFKNNALAHAKTFDLPNILPQYEAVYQELSFEMNK